MPEHIKDSPNAFIRINVMQFGQPYAFNGQEDISEMDGVHIGIGHGDLLLANLRLSPAEAFTVARHISEAAHKALAAQMKGEGREITREALETAFRKDSE